ncbi:alpha/beta hydrolase [Kibdelosporangium philippinense]|uniref:Alpha/beta hydrolase n=1 Tax=Kibdelosporangium philippinense TaxID=211113 RepID=A0ABS8ZUH2_9PSEU|nr:alpha/beta hydrolase [Kibdelosporangium philippinense]MCE7011339.1 alpha/beta hydrolase [Kibdelosporangium philippinense]
MKISRRSFSAMVASGAAAMAVGAPASASPARNGNVVLVHGAYADGSCWAKVIPLLLHAGVAVTAVQHPLTSLAEGAAATRRALDLQTGPTVLMGHSFGGSVITEAGDHPNVSSLIYLSARAPEVGEDYGALAAKFPTPPANAGLVYNNGFGGLTERAFLNDFANGVPRSEARVLYAAQGRLAQTLFGNRTTAAAWKAKPARYLITTEDRTTSPELQRFVAERMGAQISEASTGHLSFIVRPSLVARLILDALP